MDTKWVVGKIKHQGINQQSEYSTIRCDKSYKAAVPNIFAPGASDPMRI